MGSKQTGSTTTTQTAAPWAGQQPYLTDLYSRAQNVANLNPITAYPGQTVAPFTPTQTQALDLTTQRALAGSPVGNAAQESAYNTLTGQYLSAGNPYFGNMVHQIAQAINPQVASGFEAGGRLGSGAQANAFESELARQAGALAYQNYGQERGNMLQTQAQAPTLAGMDYTDLSALYGAGSTAQQQNQAYLTADQQRFLANQQGPYSTLQNYSALIGQPTGFGSTTTQPYFTNPLASALGTGMGVVGLASKLSDIRLKTDLVHIGRTNDFNLYSFRYIGSRERWVGVMAQEVLETKPEAVILGVDGYYRVDYGMIGVPFRRVQ